MNKISVVISAYNEEGKIRGCLESVKFADEVIVVDNSSTDATAKIATTLGAKIFVRENNLMLNVNKNFGFSKASNEWILNLDADERVSAELMQEIMDVVGRDSKFSAYSMPRKNIIFGKWIRHTGWYPDAQIRLFKKTNGKFPAKHVHEKLKVEGLTGELTNPLIHESYSSVREFLLKFFVIYAPNEADMLIEDHYTFKASDFIARPFSEFVKRFYHEKGYKDGLHGLVLSLLMSFYHFVVFCLVWEKKGFVNKSDDSREILRETLPKAAKELRYWDETVNQAEAKNPLTAFYYRVRRKLSAS